MLVPLLSIQLLLVVTASSPPTIPSSRDQPSSSDASCTVLLDLPENFFDGVAAACSPEAAATDLCCPALASWLLSAYSASALATRVRPTAARSYDDLPLLPADADQPCVAVAEAALRSRGVQIRGSNDTCGAASCACGVSLRPLQCPGPFVVRVTGGGNGRWAPTDDVANRLEVGCGRPGPLGCADCLRALYQLKSNEKMGSIDGVDANGRRECQLAGLTWLLSRNRTRYLQTAAYVLRAFRAAATNDGYPTTCSFDSAAGMPLPVGADLFPGTASVGLSPHTSPIHFFIVLIFFFFFFFFFLLNKLI